MILQHVIKSIKGDHELSYSASWDEKLNELLSSGEIITKRFSRKLFVCISLNKSVYNIMLVDGSHHAVLYKVNGKSIDASLYRRPRLSTMIKLNKLCNIELLKENEIKDSSFFGSIAVK